MTHLPFLVLFFLLLFFFFHIMDDPRSLMTLPDELIGYIFAHVPSSDLLHEVRQVNSVCRRVATPMALSQHPIRIQSTKKLARAPEIFGPAIGLLASVKNIDVDTSGWVTQQDMNDDEGDYDEYDDGDDEPDNLNADDQGNKEDEGLKSTLYGFSSLFPGIYKVTIRSYNMQFPRNMRVNGMMRVLEQLQDLPSFQCLVAIDAHPISARYMTWAALLPRQLTDVHLSFSGTMALGAVETLLDQLPQLVSLRIDKLIDTSYQGKPLESWVSNGMEKKGKQYLSLRHLHLAFNVYPLSSTELERVPLLIYVFFTCPQLLSLQLLVDATRSSFNQLETLPTIRVSPFVVARCGYPKKITIYDATMDEPFVDDATREQPWYMAMPCPSSLIENITLHCNLQHSASWLSGFPLDGIKTLSLTTIATDFNSHRITNTYTEKNIHHLIGLAPQLQRLHIYGQDCRLQNTLVVPDPLENCTSGTPVAQTPAQWVFDRCTFDSPLVLHRLIENCSEPIDVRLHLCYFTRNSSIHASVAPWPNNDTPLAVKLRAILNYQHEKMALVSLPAANLKLKFWAPAPLLYIVLQNEDFLHKMPAVRAFLGSPDTNVTTINRAYELTPSDIKWMLAQIDRIYEQCSDGVARRVSVPSFPNNIAEQVWRRLSNRLVYTFTCISLRFDGSIFEEYQK
ncbi:hypothetical protein BC940DRAFT_299094 [Gongronella butleri]|nr:hypothetical protein BC940DRAFT_299094 [Gongronella butleri]